MITSEEIQKKDFTRGVRGYKEEEVDRFLDIVSSDIDGLIRENAALKESLKTYSQELERYRGSERAIMGTLEAAKALMADISASAEKRADIVLKNAELDAERIRREARESVEHMTEEAVALSRRWELFSARFRNLIETELARFDSFSTAALFDDKQQKKLTENHAANSDAKPLDKSNPLSMMSLDKTFVATRKV